jgi:hypothetical protein
MRPQPEIIRLGMHEWCIRPLTLSQVQAIEPILMATQQTKNNVKAAIEIVAIALSRDHAAAVEGLNEIEATASDIAAAMTCVLRLGGFIEAQPGVNQMGEARADAIQSEDPSASISASSMQG